MAETRLDLLRAEASLDASRWEQGARQVEAGANAIAGSAAKAGEAVVVVERKVVESATAFDRLSRSLDPSIKATIEYERAQSTLNRALDAGKIAQAEHARLLDLAQTRYNSLTNATASTGSGMSRFSQGVGQAGFQLQDFAVQVQGGTSALTAMGQQLPQFLGIFGTGGAIAGAIVAVGVLAAGFLGLGAESEKLEKRLAAQEGAYKAVQEAADAWAGGMQKEMEALLRLQAFYKNTTQAVREFEAARIKAAQNENARARTEIAGKIAPGGSYASDAASGNLPVYDAMGNVTGYTTGDSDPRNKQYADLTRGIGEGSLTLERLAEYHKGLDELAKGQDQIAARAREARAASLKAQDEVMKLQKADQALTDQMNALNGNVLPLPPDDITMEVSGKKPGGGRRKPQIEYENMAGTVFPSTTIQAALQKAQEIADRQQEKREDKIEAAIIREEDQRQKSFDRTVSNYSAQLSRGTVDALWDGVTKGGDLFSGLASAFGSALKTSLAAALDATFMRPLMNDLLSAFGFTGTAGGGGGLSLVGGSGLLGQGANWISDKVSGIWNTPLWTGRKEAMGPFSADAPTTPFYGAGGITVGNLASGGLAGFGVGSMLNSLVGGNSTGGMIGSGLGGLAGAAIGSIIPGVGTMLGGLIGGGGGGLLGGLFGPTKKGMEQRSGGDVAVGMVNGQLAIIGSGGKRWDGPAALAQVQQQVDAVNQELSSRGLTLTGGGAMVGFGQASKNPGSLDPNSFARYLSSSNPNVATALRAPTSGSFQGALSNADWVTQTYEPLVRASQATSDFQKSLNALWEQYAPAIAKSNELGLATQSLSDAWGRAIAQTTQQRNMAINTATNNLTVRSLRATGATGAADMMAYNVQAENEWFGFHQQLVNWGLTAQEIEVRMTMLARTQGEERIAIQKQINDAAIAEAKRLAEAQQGANDATSSLWARLGRARGDNLGASLLDFDIQAGQEWRGFAEALQNAGIVGQDFADRMKLLETTLGEERLDIAKRFADEQVEEAKRAAEEAEQKRQAAAGNARGNVVNLSDYVRSLRGGDLSPLALPQQYYSAGVDYNTALGAFGQGDANSLSRIPGLASDFLEQSRRVNGSGAQYAADFRNVIEGLSGIGAMNEDQLTASFMAAETRAQTATLAGELEKLREEFSRLRLDLQQNVTAPARAA